MCFLPVSFGLVFAITTANLLFKCVVVVVELSTYLVSSGAQCHDYSFRLVSV